ncbi:hypothetical protein FRC04_008399 [Tulasnella sp. 424]|nr:hypothetical protein FRC04_008399 [Tulasnella sp. 424]
MIETIYIARHGFRLNWVTTNWTSATGTARDPTLAAYGVTQAEQLAKHFASLPESDRPTAIFSSAFYRCLQTATPVATALNLPLYVEHGETTGIGEWYSPVEPGTGLHPRPGNAHSLKQYFPLIDTSYSSTWLVSRYGESLEEVQRRTDGFLEAFIPRVEGGDPAPLAHHGSSGVSTHKKIILIGHAASCITLIKSLAGSKVDGADIRIGTCSVTRMEKESEGGVLGAFKVVGQLADASFLTNGVERDWGFRDILVDETTGRVINDHGVPGSENEVDETSHGGLLIPTSKM